MLIADTIFLTGPLSLARLPLQVALVRVEASNVLHDTLHTGCKYVVACGAYYLLQPQAQIQEHSTGKLDMDVPQSRTYLLCPYLLPAGLLSRLFSPGNVRRAQRPPSLNCLESRPADLNTSR